MGKPNLRKVTRAENKSRKKAAEAAGADRAYKEGKGSETRLTGYYSSEYGGKVVSHRDARKAARKTKKEAKTGVKLASYRMAATEKLNKKKMAKASAQESFDRKMGRTYESDYDPSPTKRAKLAGYSRTQGANWNKSAAAQKAKEAGMSDKKIKSISKKASTKATKRYGK